MAEQRGHGWDEGPTAARGTLGPKDAATFGQPVRMTSNRIDSGFVSPVRLRGELDGPSRGLWLVKWLLAFPHYVILVFLWIGFAITTVIAWFAILFTARYPRPLFDFGVGVLRWNWRVVFYAYGVLGTDRYPPFTLDHADYPADLEIDYPQRLSRGLIWVKSWLLAIPHYLIIGAVAGGQALVWGWGDADHLRTAGLSLITVIVLIAAVGLLFTSRYPGRLFDLVIGIHRWMLRVTAYTLLLRDDYPPFRLDQGPLEPAARIGGIR